MKNCKALILETATIDLLMMREVLCQFETIDTKYVRNTADFFKNIDEEEYQLFVIDITSENFTIEGISLVEAITKTNAWTIITSLLDVKDFYEKYKGLRFKKFILKKPLDKYTFKATIESFLLSQIGYLPAQAEVLNFLMLKLGNFLHKVSYPDISLIQTDDHATTIFTDYQKYTAYKPLKAFEEIIQGENFQKVNRNSLINLNKIKRVNLKENYVEILNFQVQISRGCKSGFIKKYTSLNETNSHVYTKTVSLLDTLIQA